MYSVIIVDDEHVIRQGLKKIIDWENLGFEIVDEAKNGLEAFDKIMTQNPDLVMLDIRMPGMDGITLLEKMRDIKLTTKVIFLTGFAEFDYAKSAIALGVESFLTKPFDENELTQTLIDIHDDLLAESLLIKQLELQKKLEEKNTYRRLLLGEKGDTETLDLEGEYCVVEVLANEEIHDLNPFFDAFQEEHQSLICLLIAGNWVIIFPKMSMTRIRVALYDLSNKMKSVFKQRFLICVGRQVIGQNEIDKSFQEVKQLEQKWYLFEDKEIVYSDEQSTEVQAVYTLDAALLFGYIEVGNLEGIHTVFTEAELNFQKMTLSFSRIKGLCVSTLLIILEKVKHHYPNQNGILENSQVIESLYNKTNLIQLMKLMKSYVIEIHNNIHSGSRESTMYRVLDYVDHHYDENLKLERLGTIFGYNSSYLGTIFKQHTGMSFKNYLDSIRIEMAKKLLKEGSRKVYEVSELVGYSNVDYFHSKFKKYVKVSPKKYQSIHKEK